MKNNFKISKFVFFVLLLFNVKTLAKSNLEEDSSQIFIEEYSF